jgi:exosortase
MSPDGKSNEVPRMLWILAAISAVLPFAHFLKSLTGTWFRDPEFSYGILIPLIVTYLVWKRRSQLKETGATGWPIGFWIVIAGCGIQILGSQSGSFLLSGVALTCTIIGAIGFLWGLASLRVVAGPLTLLILMVPLPSYMVGGLSWYLQAVASTASAATLRFLGVPIFQDGNLLRLSNYVLEVKQACSGSRSIFALLAMACVLGISTERKSGIRVLLVGAAPILAVGANVIRIVVTGLIAWQWGDFAAEESLHAAWGVLVFVIALFGLLGFQRILQWATHENA